MLVGLDWTGLEVLLPPGFNGGVQPLRPPARASLDSRTRRFRETHAMALDEWKARVEAKERDGVKGEEELLEKVEEFYYYGGWLRS